ncbi:hypothetical protein B9479_001257 [Cryptococcus floricola]|uniref:NAD+ kinase n=1 Tax=Cryptococcus floricola TaxID=2591691 RepID=A0A5D3B4F1_9TREE|nr:hypothetical protein B9479_001257 [Cryptococcus floricola]
MALPASSIEDIPQRPSLKRNSSAYLRKLELGAAREKERFGLNDIHISTSPSNSPSYEEEIYIQLSPRSAQARLNDEANNDQSPAMPSTTLPNSPPQGLHRQPSPSTPHVNVPTTARMRHPAPPSPLSQVLPAEKGTSGAAAPTPKRDQLGAPSLAGLNIPEASPCFIHSHLDRHGSLQDWLKNKTGKDSAQAVAGTSSAHRHASNATHPVPQSSQAAPVSHSHAPPSPSPSGSQSYDTKGKAAVLQASRRKEVTSSEYESDDQSDTNRDYRKTATGFANGLPGYDEDQEIDEEGNASLTKQLAETARGVREMSKELGRTKVRSRIQHVLIVTKARDNRLIKLTRELALYLMHKRPATSPDRNGASTSGSSRGERRDRGMVVYVDAQLRNSKRFDADGLQRDYPQLFEPMARRRSSSSASLSTFSALSSAHPSTTSMRDAARQASNEEGQLRYWTSDLCSESPHLFDFVITLGGDGTVLFTSWLFQKIVPPVLPFALGSLGFLTNFDFYNYKHIMDRVVDEGIRVNLRMRFTCTVYRAIAPEENATAKGKKRKAIKKPGGEILMSRVDKGGWESLEGPTPSGPPSDMEEEGEDKEIMCYSTRPVEQFEVLNDLVVDRGPSPYVSLLELFGKFLYVSRDEHHLTTVQADGLTVSTPTGSTAYSLSAGGSLVHPQIPAILITPICPHTLSFRPMLLPDSMELRVCVPYNSRSTAWASFDGRGRVELKQGDHIKVTASKYPFPTVCADKASTDWFSSISRTLRWNEREKQKSFVVVEEDSEPPKYKTADGKEDGKKKVFDEKKAKTKFEGDAKGKGNEIVDAGNEEDDEDEDEDEDESFDIDDSVSGPSSPPHQHAQEPQVPPQKLHNLLNSHQNGLETPNRFVTPYSAPPAISQRHLVEALHKAEIKAKDNEVGQRDNIRGDLSDMRVDGHHHLIPPGRSRLNSPTESTDASDATQMDEKIREEKTPRPHNGHDHHRHHHHHHHHRPGEHSDAHSLAERVAECKSKAFAFFGQDDSASECSDDHSYE